jgi:hypothetical protein
MHDRNSLCYVPNLFKFGHKNPCAMAVVHPDDYSLEGTLIDQYN